MSDLSVASAFLNCFTFTGRSWPASQEQRSKTSVIPLYSAGWEGFPEWAIRIPNKPGGLKPPITTDRQRWRLLLNCGYARGTSCLCAQQLHTICFAVRLPGLEREGNWPGKMMKVIRLLDGIEMNGVSVSAVSYLQTLLRDVEKGSADLEFLLPCPTTPLQMRPKKEKQKSPSRTWRMQRKTLGNGGCKCITQACECCRFKNQS